MTRPTSWTYFVLPGIHLLAALTGPAAYLLAGGSIENSPDANIGAGLGLIWTGVCGAPWSIPFWNELTVDGTAGNTIEAILTACALLNVALHALLLRLLWRWRRRTRPGDTTPSGP